MSTAEITKHTIGVAVKHIMATSPFDRVTTQDIIDECGISRKTFYYHFRDKYDAVNWIFETEILDDIVNVTTLDTWEEGSYKLCHYIAANREFYTNVVNASGQNCFVSFLYTMTERQVSLLLDEACRRTMTHLSEEDRKFLIDFYYNAFIGVFLAWIKDGFKDSPERIVHRWICVVDKSLEHYVSNLSRIPRRAELR